MPRKARELSPTGIYHIINRGINREAIFLDERDFSKYLSLLKRFSSEGSYEILAYCLMENHIHLLMNLHDDPPGIFIKKISVSYSAFFNRKYKRTGHLFQDRFKSIAVEDVRYLLTVVQYIHNNPEKAGVCSADKYKWSSFGEYVNSGTLVNTDYMLRIAGGRESFLYSGTDCTHSDMENMKFENRRKTDSEALSIIRSAIKEDDPRLLKCFNREYRDQAIRDILMQGVSAVQLARLTGINRSTIIRSSKD